MSKLEIANIDIIPVQIPILSDEEPTGLAPYVGNDEELVATTRLLIRLETKGGEVGWGEMWPEAAIDPAAAKSILIEDIVPELTGRKVWNTESLHDLFEREYLDIRVFLGGIEIAMWDAYGKHLDAPLHELFGGKQGNRIPFAYLVGIFDEERSRMHARRAYDRGFDVLKAKGSEDWERDVRRIIAMDDEVDGNLEFRLDPNQGWSPEDAVRALTVLEDNEIYLQYVEQPVRIDSPATLSALRNRVRTPIAVNEDTYRPRTLANLCQQGVIDAAVVDLVPAGGITALKRLAGIAHEFNVGLAHHNAFDLGIKTAAIIHTVASTPGFSVPSDTVYYGLADDVITNPFSFEDGMLKVPKEPGLGVTVDENKIDEYRLEF